MDTPSPSLLQTIRPDLFINCIWCKKPLMKYQKTFLPKTCRSCHKKQHPCDMCGGPVGRTLKSRYCYKCQD